MYALSDGSGSSESKRKGSDVRKKKERGKKGSGSSSENKKRGSNGREKNMRGKKGSGGSSENNKRASDLLARQSSANATRERNKKGRRSSENKRRGSDLHARQSSANATSESAAKQSNALVSIGSRRSANSSLKTGLRAKCQPSL